LRPPIIREQVREPDLFGKWGTRWRIVRTSNAYQFRDPLPCAEHPGLSKSENPPGTLIQDSSLLKKEPEPPADPYAGIETGLLKTLISLGTSMAKREGLAVT
jgi:hypothetical protein